jgi:hypothetical protein
MFQNSERNETDTLLGNGSINKFREDRFLVNGSLLGTLQGLKLPSMLSI